MFQQLERSHDFSYIVIFWEVLMLSRKNFYISSKIFFHPYKPYHAYSAYISDDIF